MMRGSSAVVIWPKVPAFSAVLGLLKRAWFRTLNASQRTSILKRSWMEKVLHKAASIFQREGPTMVSRPMLPKVPADWRANAAVLNHALMLGLARFGSPTALGRSDPTLVSEMWV